MNNLIQSLNKLILPATIKSRNVLNAYNALAQYKSDDWKNYKSAHINEFNKQLIYGNQSYELFLISWCATRSGWHTHPEHGCLLKVLEGDLYEYVIKNKHIQINYLAQHMIAYKTQYQAHNIIAPDIAYSLHIYSPIVK